MEILNYRKSKNRRFHISILGRSVTECMEFYEKLSQLPSIQGKMIPVNINPNRNGQFKGSFICKTSNHKKFKVELENLISQYKKES